MERIDWTECLLGADQLTTLPSIVAAASCLWVGLYVAGLFNRLCSFMIFVALTCATATPRSISISVFVQVVYRHCDLSRIDRLSIQSQVLDVLTIVGVPDYYPRWPRPLNGAVCAAIERPEGRSLWRYPARLEGGGFTMLIARYHYRWGVAVIHSVVFFRNCVRCLQQTQRDKVLHGRFVTVKPLNFARLLFYEIHE